MMEEGADLKIEKLEKGPLQRFKNQNLLLKKFGEVGLQVYKVITGKRTTEELRSDLDMDKELYTKIITYMEDAGMVRLVSEEAPPEKPPKEKAPEIPEEEIPEELPEEIAPEEEELPEEEIMPEFEEEEKPKKKKKAPPEEEIPPEEEVPEEEEIIPEFEEEEKPKKKKKAPPEEEEILPEEEEVAPEEEMAPEEEEFAPEEIEFGGLEEGLPEEEGVSPVEKIIRDKYGDIGVQVYTLIDGQRTAEEIMEETGLDESKLVEILDFLDEQGIIKLEYPKGKEEIPEAIPKEVPAEEFAPMIEEEEFKKGLITVVSPDLIPAKAPVPIVKSVQLRAKTMLRYGDVGDKVLAAIDGKSDLVDLSLKLNIPLYKLMDILNFLKSEEGVLLNPVPRTEIRRKYGDDGYNVYKKYGKEGLMLYELIGKELSIKEMADKITTNKQQVFEMFLFIYEVLGIEMPINKDALKKQLGL